MKTLTKDEIGTLARERKRLVHDIEGAWANYQSSVEQLKRHHYAILGEKFILLRLTFKGSKHECDIEFAKFCKDEFPFIKTPQRSEYMIYRKKLVPKLGPVVSTSSSTEEHVSRRVKLPPLRQTTNPRDNKVKVERERVQARYGKIVDEEASNGERFVIPPTKREAEKELVVELAGKIISTGYKVLSVKMHPDKDGGSNEAQRRLNAAKRLLEDALTREELFQ